MSTGLNSEQLGSNLFYDVLSGEFCPPTDHANQNHTLGRLMLDTLAHGEDQETTRRTYVHRPAWAPGSLAVAEAMKSGLLVGLIVQRDVPEGLGPDWAMFMRIRVRYGGPHIRITGSHTTETTLPLQHDPKLSQTRQVVTDIAQGFYDRLHANGGA